MGAWGEGGGEERREEIGREGQRDAKNSFCTCRDTVDLIANQKRCKTETKRCRLSETSRVAETSRLF